MTDQIETYLNLQRMGPAQRATALGRMLPLVEASSELGPVVDLLKEALAANREAVETARRFKGESVAQQMHKEQAVALDRRLDKALAGLFQVLEGLQNGLPDDHSRRGEIDALRDELFPRGLAAVVNRRYVDQHHVVNSMLDQVRRTRGWSAPVVALGLGPLLDEIAETNEAYGRALTNQARGTSYRDVQAADLESFRSYCTVIVRLLAVHPSSSPSDTERREALLAPVHAQEQESRLYRRRRSEARRGEDGADEPAAPPDDSGDTA